jgi:hypothetical protein
MSAEQTVRTAPPRHIGCLETICGCSGVQGRSPVGKSSAVRVAVWNLGWNRTKAQLQMMWSILRDEIRADVALLQEAVRPVDAHSVWHPIDRGPRRGRRWGSAVVGFTVEVEEVTMAQGRANSASQLLGRTWPGSVAVAKTGAGQPALTFVSLYGLIDAGYADTTVNRQLSDLTPLFDDPAHEKRLVLGGDLNITTQWTGSDKRYGIWEAVTLKRIAAFGLVDCLDLLRPPGLLEGCACSDGDRCRHIQTQRHHWSTRPWQNDYLFASAALTSENILKQAHVHDSDAIRALGDHHATRSRFQPLKGLPAKAVRSEPTAWYFAMLSKLRRRGSAIIIN